MKLEKSIINQRKNSISDIILILGIYLLLFSGGISNLKVDISGISITEAGGKPYLYEVAALLIFLALILYLIGSRQIKMNREKKIVLFLMFFTHMPIFIIHMLYSENIAYGYFGLGQLRLMLLLCALTFTGIVYPVSKNIIKQTFIAIVIVGLINGVYAILAHFQFVEILYVSSPRIPGFERHSGLLSVPASFGVLSGINVVIGYWLIIEKKMKIGVIIAVIGAIGLFLSISFTGILMIFIAICFLLLREVRKNIFLSFAVSLIVFLFLIIIVSNIEIIFSQNVERIESIAGSFRVWYESFTFGVPWGELERYTVGFDMIFPHNWLLAFLVHGGTISFIFLTCLYMFYTKKIYHIIKNNQKNIKNMDMINILVIFMLISALFEQIFLLAPTVFILYLFIGFSTHENNK